FSSFLCIPICHHNVTKVIQVSKPGRRSWDLKREESTTRLERDTLTPYSFLSLRKYEAPSCLQIKCCVAS
ncbi:hypothetical protein JMJ77_0005737, partial [Colletotrichum scovillei]